MIWFAKPFTAKRCACEQFIWCCLQHLETLLGAPDQEVVTATLVTLVALVRKTHIASIRFPGSQEQNARLLALAQGWGGKEQVQPSKVHEAGALDMV